MNNRMKKFMCVSMLLILSAAMPASSAEWHQKKQYTDNYGGDVTIEATYYAAEYVERSTQEEADKNLWTSDEAEDYRYNLLQQLKLDDTIPIFLKFTNNGPAIRMAPFEQQVYLTIGKHRLSPVDYDKRFNFKITGQREGFVYFPRYDSKGNPYLTPKVKTVKFELNGAVTPVTINKSIEFLWDVKDDDPSRLLKGKSGARLEMDRLTKRISNLTDEGKKLQDRLNEIQAEIQKVNQRMMELQKQL